MQQSDIDRLAAEIHAQYGNRQSQRPLSELHAAHCSLEDAYRIQDVLIGHLQAAGAGATVGYKIALTTPKMQAMCGVDHPLAGALLANRVQASPATIALAGYQHLGVEFEVAVKLGADLAPTDQPHTRTSVATAIATCMPAYELIEDRNADYAKLDAASLIADNCWNAGVVLGAAAEHWQALDLELATTRLWHNGAAVGEGQTGDALGHPLAAVAWLANVLNSRGKTLVRDSVVLTGSTITTRFPEPGDALRFEVEGLGQVMLSMTA